MRALILMVALFSTNAIALTATEATKGFAHTYTCAIILANKASDALPRITLNREVPPDSGQVFIGLWAEMQAAATVYESAATRYLNEAYQINPTEYGSNSPYIMQDAVRQNLSKWDADQQNKYADACLQGYRIASDELDKNKYNL